MARPKPPAAPVTNAIFPASDSLMRWCSRQSAHESAKKSIPSVEKRNRTGARTFLSDIFVRRDARMHQGFENFVDRLPLHPATDTNVRKECPRAGYLLCNALLPSFGNNLPV